MHPPTYLAVTSINPPNNALRSLAIGAADVGIKFIVIGDEKSPSNFHLDQCRYYDLESQRALAFKFATLCPIGHYARKNIAYLVALSEGAEVLIETDDDNFPLDEFWAPRSRQVYGLIVEKQGWVNVYRHFSDANIWPRGLPLEVVSQTQTLHTGAGGLIDCPIQQGLADGNPDVDAICRLTRPLPQSFRHAAPIVLGTGCWSPFNSQNTTWWRDAAPLLYLPSYCSFRITDIWRSFVAQRIAWENDWRLSFHAPTVRQTRNEHNLMKDFEDEIPGYLNNKAIAERLSALDLKRGQENIGHNLQACYSALVEMQIVSERELALLDAWLDDLNGLPRQACAVTESA